MPKPTNKSVVMVAKCLSGAACRYHGRPTPRRHRLLDRLAAKNQVVFFCPEEASGMPTPRPPARWRDGRLIAAGRDVTQLFDRGARLALELAQRLGVKKFYGLRGSPICDPRSGLTARLLRGRRIKCHFG